MPDGDDDAKTSGELYEQANPCAHGRLHLLSKFQTESRHHVYPPITLVSTPLPAVMIGDKPPPTATPKKTRARKPKVKTGCKTCKIRGVKCDEAKPACRRCISTGRTCDGYGIWGGGGNAYGSISRIANPSQTPRYLPLATSTTALTSSPLAKIRSPLTNVLTLPPLFGATTQHEQRAFEYFLHRTSRKLPGVFDSPFWSSLVFQASARDPAVLHALIALGAVDLGKATRELAFAQERVRGYERVALVQYNMAIECLGVHFRRRDGEGRRVALITCMLFICIELMRERFKTANAHLGNGLKLLTEIRPGKREEKNKRKNKFLVSTELEIPDFSTPSTHKPHPPPNTRSRALSRISA
ncbi:hypothetical protein V492_02932 [Pseudogymnoascus sp. VKM F-4246]|nr:hypothetical protein V492_02932 [Pseudogymnoascus sp. VKM F-4246]